MERKLVFFDIDGTLLDSQGEIPDSARQAIQAAKKNGHLMFLATGRSKVEVPGYIKEIGFEGMVLGAGAYAEYQGKVLFHHKMEKAQIREIIEYLTQRQASIIFETNEKMYAAKEVVVFLEKMMAEQDFTEAAKREFINCIDVSTTWEEMPDINKFMFFNARCDSAEIEKRFADRFIILPNSIMAVKEYCSGEVSQLGITKARGLESIQACLGIARENMIAIGDGLNDMEMIQFAGIGVAMADGAEELKRVADRIAPAVKEDGIAVIMKQLNLI